MGNWPSAIDVLPQASDGFELSAGGVHPLAAYARALMAFAQWHNGKPARAIDEALEQQWTALQQLGLSKIDEAADVLMMRSLVAGGLGDAARASGYANEANQIYAKLGLKVPAWLQ